MVKFSMWFPLEKFVNTLKNEIIIHLPIYMDIPS